MYESLPCFCKQCRVLGHTTCTCNIGTGHKHKKRSHEAPVRFGCSSPSAETAAVEKQQPYNEGLHDEPSINLMSVEVATTMDERFVSSGRKRSKLAEAGHSDAQHSASPNVIHVSDDRNVIADMEPIKRQYLTRSRVVVATRGDMQPRTPLWLIQSIEATLMILLPHPLFDFFSFGFIILWIFICKGACSLC